MFELRNKSLNLADCLDVLIELYKNGKKEFIDLIYIDPPFNSNRNYNVILNGGELSEEAFKDTWSKIGYMDQLDMVSKLSPNLYKFLVSLDQTNIPKSYITYLTVMGVRCFYMRETLKETGSFYYHCDPTASHYIKMMLDMIFGIENFRNEIVWSYKSGGVSKRYFAQKHDVIFLYSKTDKFFFEQQKERTYKYGGIGKSSKQEYFKDEEGDEYCLVAQTDVFSDIGILSTHDKTERLGYPTQKPEKLIERIIKASCPPNGLVVDFYMGGGTTVAVAEKLGMNWIGVDINPRAIEIAEKRIIDLGQKLKTDFTVSGIPKSSKELRKLIESNVYGKDKNSKFALEDIVCKYYLKDVVGNEKKVGDDSIDGRFMFDFEGKKCSGIVQVTTSGNKNHLKNSCAEMLRAHDMLVYVTFEDKITEPLQILAKKHGKIGGVDKVQLLSLEDLIDKGKQFDLPKEDTGVLTF